MVTRFILERCEDWLEQGSYRDSRLLHSDKSDRILVCPSHLGQGYIQEIPLRDDLSLVIKNYRLDRDLIIDIPTHNSSIRFSFPLTGSDARYSTFYVCFGLREIHIARSHQQIFDVQIVFTQSTIVTYLHEFMARLLPQTYCIAEQITQSIHRYQKGYSTSNTKEMLGRILQDAIYADSDATLKQILSDSVYSKMEELENAGRNLISVAMERAIGQILLAKYLRKKCSYASKSLEIVLLLQ